MLLPLSLLLMSVALLSDQKNISEFHSFVVKDIKGNDFSLAGYKGHPVLVVNVASKCGYTYQYEGLELLYKKYKDKGFKIIGFPANNFLWQEPGSNTDIAQFCKLQYGVTFDMMSKISVKGDDMHPLYKYLTESGDAKGKVDWNFEKFLINKEGKVINRFKSKVKPEDKLITDAIESIL